MGAKDGKSSGTESKFARCIKAPIRVLCKARDLYVRSMTNCAGNMNYSMYPTTLPKSFSVASSRASDEEDIREVMRMVSQRSQREKSGTLSSQSPAVTQGLPKSFSVGIGRIDEDKPCYFQEDIKVNTDVLYPRSRSYAVTKRRTGMLIA
ncbi:hypothetical protein H6P81_020770 [Aristolochia fimbriata]|uniref:Uncharacterized protein n=1 Tax=Aristolochia fimbriata TaxID=158543 RepID=A0AAV7DX47_ARIFI|nr:hypothetical protein H6P81_020770 [Aristolochia fimbriata]